MSDDDNKKSLAVPTPEERAHADEAPKKVFGVPVDMFVRGSRTTTTAHDNEQARITYESELRRDQAAAEKRIASIPIEQGGGVMHGGPLMPEDGEQGYVELFYLTAKGEQRYEFGEPTRCVGDVMLVGDGELCFILVCPSCKERGVPMDRCQMRVRQSNRKWEFSAKRAGDMIPWVEGNDPVTGQKLVKMYKSAGTIVESERFKCDQCGWAARIYDNKVRPDR
jgi:hypothetical protein